ncbi:MAG: phosphogluconate dehydrogenase (NAD(+)-dependent, decarboxylating) [Armatimonadota bacterium]
MHAAIIGLGKMGIGMASRLHQHGHCIWGYDVNPDRLRLAAEIGVRSANSISDLVASLPLPRIVWLMLPAGTSTEEGFMSVSKYLGKGDIIVDGSNSFYMDTIRRFKQLSNRFIEMLDVGVSGGVRGQHLGYCLMIGGKEDIFKIVEPLFQSLACENGYARVGEIGAGHFAKMVHNAIEYVFLQALGEGFELLNASDYNYDLASIAKLWNNGSVIRSWLLELTGEVFQSSEDLKDVHGWVANSGEARWVIEEAIERDVPLTTVAVSLMMRLLSRQEDSFSAKLIAKLREEFGGHEVKKKTC